MLWPVNSNRRGRKCTDGFEMPAGAVRWQVRGDLETDRGGVTIDKIDYFHPKFVKRAEYLENMYYY